MTCSVLRNGETGVSFGSLIFAWYAYIRLAVGGREDGRARMEDGRWRMARKAQRNPKWDANVSLSVAWRKKDFFAEAQGKRQNWMGPPFSTAKF